MTISNQKSIRIIRPSGRGTDINWVNVKKIMVAQRPMDIALNKSLDPLHKAIADQQIDIMFCMIALCPQHQFTIWTHYKDRLNNYASTIFDDDVRVTKAVNRLLTPNRKSWGACGGTATEITTLCRGSGARDYMMYRASIDGGVEYLFRVDPETGNETWNRLSDHSAARVHPNAINQGNEFGWGLKSWPLPNLKIEAFP
jgi:hypothetical protein